MSKFWFITLIICSTCLACNVTPKDKALDISVEDAKELVNQGYVFIDLRTPEEIKGGKIEGAVEIDFKASDFDSKVAKLSKSSKYIAYCRSGGRSARSMATFKKHGIEAYNMLGGYMAWK
jgi:rhodanese-related sulfurtransferase